LSGGLRDLPARQQTLRATIAWSYDLLDEAEQRLFRRLSIFVGGCTLEAAEAIGNPDGERGVDLLDAVTSLVAKSLLRQEEGHEGEPRFGMLETIREYGLEQLEASGEGEVVRSHHAAYVLALVEGAEPELRGRGLGRLVTELANVRSALAWFAEQGREETGLRLAAALHEFWNGRALYAEGRRWLTDLLERSPAAAPELRAKALSAAGHLARGQADFPAAHALLEASIAIRRELGDAPGLAASLYQLSWLAHDLGDFRSQMALMEQRLAVCRELGDRSGIANSLRSQGHALRHLGEYPTARALLAESIALLREIGERPSLGWALKFLGEVLVDEGDAWQASAPFAEAMRLSREVGDVDLTWRVLEQIARAALVRGQAGRAARLMGAAEAIRAAHEIPLPPVWRKDLYDALLEGVRDALAPAAFASAWAEGRALPVDRAIEYALTEGATSQCPATTEQASDGRESSPLTPRERDVAALIARGLTNRRIASELVIGTRTVDAHVYRILRKLGFESRAQIAAWVVEQRLSALRSD
jgi:non-specific serine/threonine protein kinase